jgi:hypothetical protein
VTGPGMPNGEQNFKTIKIYCIGTMEVSKLEVSKGYSLVCTIEVSIITVGILHGQILSFEEFVRNT